MAAAAVLAQPGSHSGVLQREAPRLQLLARRPPDSFAPPRSAARARGVLRAERDSARHPRCRWSWRRPPRTRELAIRIMECAKDRSHKKSGLHRRQLGGIRRHRQGDYHQHLGRPGAHDEAPRHQFPHADPQRKHYTWIYNGLNPTETAIALITAKFASLQNIEIRCVKNALMITAYGKYENYMNMSIHICTHAVEDSEGVEGHNSYHQTGGNDATELGDCRTRGRGGGVFPERRLAVCRFRRENNIACGRRAGTGSSPTSSFSDYFEAKHRMRIGRAFGRDHVPVSLLASWALVSDRRCSACARPTLRGTRVAPFGSRGGRIVTFIPCPSLVGPFKQDDRLMWTAVCKRMSAVVFVQVWPCWANSQQQAAHFNPIWTYVGRTRPTSPHRRVQLGQIACVAARSPMSAASVKQV